MRKRLCKLHKELGLKAIENAPDTQSIIKKVNVTLDTERAERNVFSKRKFAHAVLVAILILSVASFATIAATMGWHHKLIEYFNNPTAKQMELMDGAFDTPMVSGTDNGYTVNVLHTLADKHGIYVLYELVPPPEKEIDAQNVEAYMQDVAHGLVMPKTTQIRDGAFGIGISSSKIVSVDNNVITLMEYTGCAMEIDEVQKLTLSVQHNQYTDDVENTFGSAICDAKKITKGDFAISVSWDFQYKSAGKSFQVDKKVDINGVNNNILKSVDVSPISIWITAEGDDALGALAPIIKFTDGTEMQYTCRDNPEKTYAMFSNYQVGDNKKGISSLGYVFDNITDIQTIESITIGDQIIKVN